LLTPNFSCCINVGGAVTRPPGPRSSTPLRSPLGEIMPSVPRFRGLSVFLFAANLLVAVATFVGFRFIRADANGANALALELCRADAMGETVALDLVRGFLRHIYLSGSSGF
jgi:hypothetical protein